jgi:hypothetical protein
MSDVPVTIMLGQREQAALARYRRDHDPAATLADEARAIIAAWGEGGGAPRNENATVDEGLRPEQLNASNDI